MWRHRWKKSKQKKKDLKKILKFEFDNPELIASFISIQFYLHFDAPRNESLIVNK